MPLKYFITLVLLSAVVIAVPTGCASLHAAKSLASSDVSQRRRQRNEEAVRSFEARRDHVAYEAALDRWEQNDSKGCREALQSLLARNPKHLDALLLLAEVNLLEKQPQEALKQVDEVLSLQPANARALYTKGLVLDAIGQSTGAVAYYEQAARAEPENNMYALCYQTAKDADSSSELSAEQLIPAAYYTPTDNDKTVSPQIKEPGPSLAAPAIRQMPAQTPPAANRVCETCDKTKKTADYADSYAHAESAVSAEEFLAAGQHALSNGAADAARTAFQNAEAQQPNNPQIPIIAAGEALRTNHPELALELLTLAAKRFHQSAGIYRMLGVAYYRLGDYQSSQVALGKALSLDKASALSYFLMGCTLAKLGQAESADAHFQQARTLDSRYTLRR